MMVRDLPDSKLIGFDAGLVVHRVKREWGEWYKARCNTSQHEVRLGTVSLAIVEVTCMLCLVDE